MLWLCITFIWLYNLQKFDQLIAVILSWSRFQIDVDLVKLDGMYLGYGGKWK